MSKNYHVVPKEDKWAVKGEGNKRATVIVETQKEAIQVAKEIAMNQKSEAIIHGRDGRIRDKDSYGRDPYPPVDKKH